MILIDVRSTSALKTDTDFLLLSQVRIKKLCKRMKLKKNAINFVVFLTLAQFLSGGLGMKLIGNVMKQQFINLMF